MTMFFKWIVWMIRGKPVVKYAGFNCGCCGKWVNEEFMIPTYRSAGRWWDTIDLCKECIGGCDG